MKPSPKAIDISKLSLLGMACIMAGCAATLTPAGEHVRVVTDQQRTSCKFIKLITVRRSLGPDKAGGALKDAMNEVAAVNGNGLFLITNMVHWADGASVAGEALDCPLI